MVTLTHIPHNAVTHKLAGPVLAFYDWLSGPPMSERDRIQRDIAEAHPQVHTIAGGV